MALWARVDQGIDVERWVAEAAAEGVILVDSRRYHLQQRDPSFFRLGFTYHDEAELDEAVRRMARALVRAQAEPQRLALVRRAGQAGYSKPSMKIPASPQFSSEIESL